MCDPASCHRPVELRQTYLLASQLINIDFKYKDVVFCIVTKEIDALSISLLRSLPVRCFCLSAGLWYVFLLSSGMSVKGGLQLL